MDDEWQFLYHHRDDLQNVMKDKSAEEFWQHISDMTNANGDKVSSVLGQFMCDMMSLPHSTATVERIFSGVNMVKTVRTNRMHARTLENRLLARQSVIRGGRTCNSWEPASVLVEDINRGRCHARYIRRMIGLLRLISLTKEMMMMKLMKQLENSDMLLSNFFGFPCSERICSIPHHIL